MYDLPPGYREPPEFRRLDFFASSGWEPPPNRGWSWAIMAVGTIMAFGIGALGSLSLMSIWGSRPSALDVLSYERTHALAWAVFGVALLLGGLVRGKRGLVLILSGLALSSMGLLARVEVQNSFDEQFDRMADQRAETSTIADDLVLPAGYSTIERIDGSIDPRRPLREQGHVTLIVQWPTVSTPDVALEQFDGAKRFVVIEQLVVFEQLGGVRTSCGQDDSARRSVYELPDGRLLTLTESAETRESRITIHDVEDRRIARVDHPFDQPCVHPDEPVGGR